MDNCSQLIQFDTFQTSGSLIEFLTISKLIKEDNYEQEKTNASSNIMDFYSGDYEQFSAKVKN